jgi:hypothetical protein
MFKLIARELRHHAPFTALGAVLGVVFMVVFRNIPEEASHRMFYVFHPLHVLLSALTTATMYRLHNCPRGGSARCNLPLLFAIGFVGSIGIATLSDSIMPYVGEVLLNMPHREAHIGFLEEPWLISGVAIVGIIIAYINPSTKFPHAGHVLISTWASVFHVLMAIGKNVSMVTYIAVLLFLFLAVWVPCCVSDIVFPLLFVKKKEEHHHHH